MYVNKKGLATRLFIAGMIVGAAFLSGACGNGGAADENVDAAGAAENAIANNEPRYGGVLRVWKQEFMNDLDPATDNRTNQESLWYETLWIMDWGLNDPENHAFTTSYLSADEMTGQLAESWEADYAAGTFSVKLKDGIKFQNKEPYNGRSLSAEDVKWS